MLRWCCVGDIRRLSVSRTAVWQESARSQSYLLLLAAELHSILLLLFSMNTLISCVTILLCMIIRCALLLGNKGLIDLWVYKQKLLQWLLMERIKQATTSPESIHELNKRLSTHLDHNLAFGKAVWCSLYVGVLSCYMMIVCDSFLSMCLFFFSVISQRFNYHTYYSQIITETQNC